MRLLAQRHLALHQLHAADPGRDVRAQLGHGVELGALGGPLVGGLGQLLDLDLLDEHPERDVLLGLVGVGRVEGEDGAGLGAVQLGVELGHDRGRADLVEVVVHADHLGARGVVAVQIDRDEVAVDGRAVHDVELGVVLAQPVELALHLFVADGRAPAA